MSNQLEITSRYDSSSWLVTSKVTESSDSDFPREVFLWTLDGQGALSEFQAIGHADQVAKYPVYDSNRTSNFGIHLVRHDESTQRVQSEDERDKVIVVLKAAFQVLLDGYEEQRVPVIEVYPAGA